MGDIDYNERDFYQCPVCRYIINEEDVLQVRLIDLSCPRCKQVKLWEFELYDSNT